MVGRILTAVVAIVLLIPAQSAAQRLGTTTPSGVVIRQNPPAPPPSRPVINPLQQRIVQPQPIQPIPLMSPTINTFPLGTVDLYQARRRGFGRFNRNPGFDQSYLGGYYGGYYGGYGGYGLPYASDLDLYMRDGIQPASPMQNTSGDAFGYLRLQVQPADAQVYVDGLYAGLVDDFDGVSAGRAFNAGPHRVEIRAGGYESHTFDVRIPANGAISYSRSLERVEQRAEFRAPPAMPKTFYVIPRCYAGTTKPRADQLPRGCDVKNVRVVPPVADGTQK
jgi:hypothetical protein